MPGERVLISGAGIAGSVLAYWLAKSDYTVVVVERSKREQKLGQGLEIEEPALQVVERMGIIEELRAQRTGELGFDLVDEQSRSFGHLGVGGLSVTGALEIMRGDLCDVLYKAANKSEQVTYRFDTLIQSLRHTGNKIIVDLERRGDNATKTEEFDFVIGADGVNSQTRKLAFGSAESLGCMKPVGAWVAYFSIPKEERDWPNSKLCHFPVRRIVWMRPTGEESKHTSVALIHVGDEPQAIAQANDARDGQRQKQAFADLYGGLGWETPRVIEQMMKAENFYSDTLKQVKLSKWSNGNVVLVGDAAWAPTPFTGEGNQLAIIGAWVLAQEMTRNRNGLAFEKYEQRLRKYVEDAQSIPLGGYAPYIFNPETAFGIRTLRIMFYILSIVSNLCMRTGVTKYFPESPRSVAILEL